MKSFLLDTSCLVAAVCSWHEHHEATVAEIALRARRRERRIMAAPALFEAYSVLTRLPPPYRLRPADALAVLEGSFADDRVVALPATSTWGLLRSLSNQGVGGGRSYDAVIVECAHEAPADLILTWNVRHFEDLTEDIEIAAPSGE